MSASEEESESQSQLGMTKAELRRSNKPIMEKRRRARINQCLDELKSLILEAMKKDPTRHSKLEKADILEMTVKHLQTVQRQQLNTAVATDPTVLTKFRSGFSECATEVSRYVSHLENVDPVVKQRLVAHLNSCVSNLQQVAPFYSHYVPYMPERLYPEIKVGFQNDFQNDFQNGDENNNSSARIQIPNGVQLIPSRLLTGELALLVPQSTGISTNYSFFPPTQESFSRLGQLSAFTSVQRSHSPLISPTTSTSSYDESHQLEHNSQSLSPRLQNRFKVPECSFTPLKYYSSQETQKSHVSSTSDHKSSIPVFIDPKIESSTSSKGEDYTLKELESFNIPSKKLRQPLSVITDKTYNNRALIFTKNEKTKRHHSDGLLTISEKKLRRHESGPSIATTTMSSSDSSNSSNGYLSGVIDLPRKTTSFNGKGENKYERKCINNTSSSVVNSDMWRPW